MNCPIETHETADLLLAYCARKLDSAAASTLESHIAACPACREFAAAQQSVWQALDSWEAAPVSQSFNRRLYQRIDREASLSWLDRLVQPFRPMLGIRGLPIAAAACLLVMAGMLLERPGQNPAQADSQVQVESVQPDQLDRTLQDLEMLGDFHRTVRADARPNPM